MEEKDVQEYQLSLKKLGQHLKTVTHHRNLVFRYCRRCGLFWQGLTHDLSKYSPTELLAGARYYQGSCSPNDAERRDTGISRAWLHHKGRNRHHYEYWIDYKVGEKEPQYTPVPMPNRFIIEMFCDRVAAAQVYHPQDFRNDMPLEYYDRCATDNLMHPDTATKLRALLELYKEKGEESFDLIRQKKS